MLLPHESRHAKLVTGTNSAKFTGLKGLTDYEIEEFTLKLQDAQVSEGQEEGREGVGLGGTEDGSVGERRGEEGGRRERMGEGGREGVGSGETEDWSVGERRGEGGRVGSVGDKTGKRWRD